MWSIILIEIVFSVCPVFVQHDAAQLFLTLWNLLKKQMKKPELVRTKTEMNTRSFGPCHMWFPLLLEEEYCSLTIGLNEILKISPYLDLSLRLSKGRGNLDFYGLQHFESQLTFIHSTFKVCKSLCSNGRAD